MRYAFISDIHANLHAWSAVVNDIANRDVNQIICLGDIVGYGPDPDSVLESVRHYTDSILLGNHDAAVCGIMDSSCFYGEAQKLIDWTRTVLDEESIAFFKQVPLSLAGQEFRCTHGDFSDPGAFDYLESENAARKAWELHSEPFMFIGHTHLPAIHKLDAAGNYVPMTAAGCILEPDCRYIINVGSVGMPRDGDHRAAYCIFDDELRSLSYCRIDYDVKLFKEHADRTVGSSEQIGFLYADYLRAQRVKPSAKPAFNAKAFMTTQDLTSLVQEFSPDKPHAADRAPTVKQVKIKRESETITADPPSPSTFAPRPTTRRKMDKPAPKKKVIMAACISLGVIILIALFQIPRCAGQRSGGSAPAPGRSRSAATASSYSPVNALQFPGNAEAFAAWPAAYHPAWTRDWTAELWFTPRNETAVILKQSGSNPDFKLVYLPGNVLAVYIRKTTYRLPGILTRNKINQVILTTVYDTDKKETRLYVIVNGKARKMIRLLGTFTPAPDKDLEFMRRNSGILEYIIFYSGSMSNDYAALRFNDGRSGDHTFTRMPRTMTVQALFLLSESQGDTTADRAPHAKPGSSLKLMGSPRWLPSSLGL